jgi:hypothetical protein
MSGGGNSGIIIDITGEADLSFHGIPLRTIKKASFVDKLAVAKNLLKMVVNGVTYDFQKTALNGAVIFGMNYGLWDFIAPDGRFPFGGYGAMTVGQTLRDMERILTEAPVPAWDSFIRWVGENLENYNLDLSGISSYWIKPIGEAVIDETCVQGADFSLGDLTDAVSFLQSLEEAFAPVIDQPLSPYVTGEGAFGFMILACTINQNTGEEQVAIPFAFRFRQ